MDQYLSITKALSDEARVRALMSLAGGELCVCQIIQMLGLSPSTVSKHMSILLQAGLVEQRKDGRWHLYRLAGKQAPAMVREALRWTMRALEDDQTIAADAASIRRLCTKSRKELATCYNAS